MEPEVSHCEGQCFICHLGALLWGRVTAPHSRDPVNRLLLPPRLTCNRTAIQPSCEECLLHQKGGSWAEVTWFKGNRRMNRVRTVFPLKSHSKSPLTETLSADYKSFGCFLWCQMWRNTSASQTPQCYIDIVCLFSTPIQLKTKTNNISSLLPPSGELLYINIFWGMLRMLLFFITLPLYSTTVDFKSKSPHVIVGFFHRLKINWSIDWKAASWPNEARSLVISWQIKLKIKCRSNIL